jgi:hypothetical protein
MKDREAVIPASNRPLLAEAVEGVVKLYEALGKMDNAAEWRSKLGSRP